MVTLGGHFRHQDYSVLFLMPIKYDIIAIPFAKFFPIQTYYYPSLDTLVLNQVIGNGVKKEIM